MAIQAYLEKYKDEGKIEDFKLSDHFINDFKEKNHISSRISHPKCHSDPNEEIIIQWKNDIKELLDTFPCDRILSYDENSWQVFIYFLICTYRIAVLKF